MTSNPALLESLGVLGVSVALATALFGLSLLLLMCGFAVRALPGVGRYGPDTGEIAPNLSEATSYSTVIFTTAEGQQFTFKSKRGVPAMAVQEAYQVPVLYNPRDPSEAYINSFVEMWAVPLISLSLGVGLLLTMILVMVTEVLR